MKTNTWCQIKGSKNQSKDSEWRSCHGCCLPCKDQYTCGHRTCKTYTARGRCCWQASPAEWLMGRLDKRAKDFTYKQRRVENWLRLGFKPTDGSWTGNRLKEFWVEYPEVYEDILVELYGKE